MAKFSLDDADVRFFEEKHMHKWEWPDNLAIPHCRYAACNEILQFEEIVRRLNDIEWLYRMSNEDIAAELSASWDLPLHITRGIADWILKDA